MSEEQTIERKVAEPAPLPPPETAAAVSNEPPGIDLLLDVPMSVTVELGRTRMPVRQLLALVSGSVVELGKLAGEPLDILVNGKPTARGEAVVVNEKFGVRLTEIVSCTERVESGGMMKADRASNEGVANATVAAGQSEQPSPGGNVVPFPPRAAALKSGRRESVSVEPMSSFRAIAVSSGKGGVGKTNVVANLAVALARRGQRVIVLDADLGLANLDTLLGLHPRATMRHVIHGECSLADVLIDGPQGIRLVPASSGFEDMTQLGAGERLHLLEQVDSLEEQFDVLLVDTAAGISSNVTFFATAAQETMVVVTPEPTSLTDAYALIKVLSTRYAEQEFGVLVNMARNDSEADRTFAHLSRVAARFLDVSLRYDGFIPYDAELPEAVRRQQAVIELAPRAQVSRAFDYLADRVLSLPTKPRPKGGLQFFFRRLLEGVQP
ncbi:MAG: flagellar motor switch protein FliN [Candidatus Binatia bacterium]|nr:flagellar motor switch protein FliN [Candidatus Binatia bacterium]